MVRTIEVHDRNKKALIFTEHIAAVEELSEENRYGCRVALTSGDFEYCDESYDEVKSML